MGVIALIVIYIAVFGFTNFFKLDKNKFNPSSQLVNRQDKLATLFKNINKQNQAPTDQIASVTDEAHFSEAQDKLKSLLYFTIFKIAAGLILIIAISVIYVQIVT